MKTLKQEIGEAKNKIISDFIMGDSSEFVKDIYNKLDKIVDEINLIKEKI